MTENKCKNICTEAELVKKIKALQGSIDKLISLLDRLEPVYASVAKLPVAQLDESGRDTVFDPLEKVTLDRYYSQDAYHEFTNSIQFQVKKQGYSTFSAHRAVGIVHLTTSAEQIDIIRALISKINEMKSELKTSLSDSFDTYYQRSKFYKKNVPYVMPLSMFRHIALALPDTSNIYFSWLNKGVSTSKLTQKQAEEFIERRVENKLSYNSDLNKQHLLELDIKRLKSSDAKHFHYIRPAKIHPRHEFLVETDEGPVTMTPQRSTTPVLVLQDKRLERYHELKDLDSLEALRKCIGIKRVSRVPVIEEYGLYEASN